MPMKDSDTLKLSSFGADLLEQVDDCFIVVTLDAFKTLLPGHDLATEQLPTPPTFNFLKSPEDEYRIRNSLCSVFNLVEKLAGSAIRWQSIACHPEDIQSDECLAIGSYRNADQHLEIPCPVVPRSLKRKRGHVDNPESQEAQLSKRPKLRTDTNDAELGDCLGNSGSRPSPDIDYSNLEATDEPSSAQADWASIVSFVEVHSDETASGFHFSPARNGRGNSLHRHGRHSKAVRARSVKYIAEALLCQHRTHFFSFYIAGSWVRVFRWDRVGCLVPPPIDLSRDPWPFYNILYRIARWNGWGFDDTAVLAAESDVQKLAAYSSTNTYLQHCRDLILENSKTFPIYKVSCPAVSTSGACASDVQKWYLIGHQIYGHWSPIGKCTRGYIALDLETCELVFLKDQWRSLGRLRTELETYKRLHQHDVENIALLVAGGDIDDHRTLTQDYVAHVPEDQRRSQQRVHTRLVTKQVGLELETYEDSAKLLEVLNHTLYAHWQAWDRAGVLHNDISPGNIMIDATTGEGFLNDWDLAKFKDDMENPGTAADPAGSSGTFAFKSALALRYPRKPPEVADDVESFVHVAIFMGMRFHWHQYSPPDKKVPATHKLRDAFNNANGALALKTHNYFFLHNSNEDGLPTGGMMKRLSIRSNTLPICFKLHRGRKPLIDVFLTRALDLLHRHYRQLNLKNYDSAYVVRPARGAPPLPDNNAEVKPRTVRSTSCVWDLPMGDGLVQWDWDDDEAGLESAPAAAPRGPRMGLTQLDLNDIFYELFCETDGTPRDLSPYYNDKAFDHFAGQGTVRYVPYPDDPSDTSDSVIEDAPLRRPRNTAKPRKTLQARPEHREEADRKEKEEAAAKSEAVDEAQCEGPAARKSSSADASGAGTTEPKRKGTRKRTRSAEENPRRPKAAMKASQVSKAEAARKPARRRRVGPATKAKVTGKTSVVPRAAVPRAGRSEKPKVPEKVPQRRSSRLAQKTGKK